MSTEINFDTQTAVKIDPLDSTALAEEVSLNIETEYSGNETD